MARGWGFPGGTLRAPAAPANAWGATGGFGEFVRGGPKPPAGVPVDPRSSWGAFRVTHGQELDPALGRKTGVPVDWTPATTRGATRIETAGTSYTDVDFTGRITAVAADIAILRSRITAPGYAPGATPPSPGTEIYGVISGVETGPYGPTFVDCTFLGGKAISAYSHGTFIRCHFEGGVDLARVSERGVSRFTECTFGGQIADAAAAHVDAIQATTTTAGATLRLDVERCWIVSQDFSGLTGSAAGNAAIQFGSYGAGTFTTGTVSDTYLDGGQYALQVGGQTSATVKMMFRGNRFGRTSAFGPVSNRNVAGIDLDETNVWADTRQPI